MSLRVNHNMAAYNAHRTLQTNHANLSKNVERLSSGLKINRAVDGPAAFMISEHMRAQVAGLDQAIDNSEMAVSMIQTTDASMSEVGSLLTRIRQLAIHASNEGPNNEKTLAADQAEIDNILQAVGEVAEKAEFGGTKLLDGSMETTGTTVGENLGFISATEQTADSRESGFEVRVLEEGTKAHVMGKTALTEEIIDQGEILTVIEQGKKAVYQTNSEDTLDTVLSNLQSAIDTQGIQIDARIDDAGNLMLAHRLYGSEPRFQISSSTAGVLSDQAGEIQAATRGRDIRGSINGETAIGKGQILTGVDGSKCVEGLKIRYYGNGKSEFLPEPCEINDFTAEGEEAAPQKPEVPPEGIQVGRVYVTQNSQKFQVGGNRAQHVGISIKSVHPDKLGANVINESGYDSLSDIDVTTFQGAQDAMLIVDRALSTVVSNRGELGAFQKNTLESNLANIRIANENLVSSESVIRDTDMAKEMANYTRNQIMSQSANAMMAQANQISERVGQLVS